MALPHPANRPVAPVRRRLRAHDIGVEPPALRLPAHRNSVPIRLHLCHHRPQRSRSRQRKPDYFRHEPFPSPMFLQPSLTRPGCRGLAFFSHGGIDYLAVARATKNSFWRSVSFAHLQLPSNWSKFPLPGQAQPFHQDPGSTHRQTPRYRWSRKILTAYLNQPGLRPSS